MKIGRRQFVAQSSSLLFSAQPFLKPLAANLFSSKKILVLICLAGGNDWINTIIPYTDMEYYKARPSLKVSPGEALLLNQTLAFHPAISPLKKIYDQKKMAILLSVGSDQSTLSHHKAIDILQDKYTSKLSWLGRYARLSGKTYNSIFPAVNIEPFLTPKDQITISNLSHENQFLFDVDIHYRLDLCRNEITTAQLAESKRLNLFERGLGRIADMIKQNCSATVYNISLGGFDTHSHQLEKHSSLLSMLSTSIFSFQNDLENNGLADKVLTIVYSEFGRSLAENDDKGTDHGLTNHMLVIGNSVKGGLYGQYNSQSTGYQFHIRQAYATLLDRWLNCNSEIILGEKFENLCFI